MKKALLVIGHGSRSKEAQEIFQQVVEIVEKKADYQNVKGAHMELASPSIPEVVEQLVEQDINQITLVPYFLYPGIHIKEDIPEIICEMKEKYPQVDFKMAEPIGAEPIMADIIISRAQKAR